MCTEKATEKIRLRSLHIMNLLICFFLLASNNPFNLLTQLSCCSFRAPLGAFSCELIKLSDLYWAVFLLFPTISVRTAVIVVLYIHRHSFLYVWTAYSPADSADLRRQTTKQQNSLYLKQPVFLCVIMQLCCIRLRDLRNLRENIHPNLLNQYTQKKPQCLPLISQIYADKTPKQQNSLNLKQIVFLCVIMQLAAFLCVICVICGRITRKRTLSIGTN